MEPEVLIQFQGYFISYILKFISGIILISKPNSQYTHKQLFGSYGFYIMFIM